MDKVEAEIPLTKKQKAFDIIISLIVIGLLACVIYLILHPYIPDKGDQGNQGEKEKTV